MDEIVKAIVESAPNLLGLLLFGFAMWRMVERLLGVLLDRVEKLENAVATLTSQVAALNSSVVLPRSGSASVSISHRPTVPF